MVSVALVWPTESTMPPKISTKAGMAAPNKMEQMDATTKMILSPRVAYLKIRLEKLSLSPVEKSPSWPVSVGSYSLVFFWTSSSTLAY